MRFGSLDKKNMIPYQFYISENIAQELNRLVPITWYTILCVFFSLSSRETILVGTTIFVLMWVAILEGVFEKRKVNK